MGPFRDGPGGVHEVEAACRCCNHRKFAKDLQRELHSLAEEEGKEEGVEEDSVGGEENEELAEDVELHKLDEEALSAN